MFVYLCMYMSYGVPAAAAEPGCSDVTSGGAPNLETMAPSTYVHT